MGNNDYCHPVLCQAANDLQDLPGQLRVQRRGRLIKEKDLRIHGERPGVGHPLLTPESWEGYLSSCPESPIIVRSSRARARASASSFFFLLTWTGASVMLRRNVKCGNRL
ncbi:MAG: hypothetical protein IJ133_05320 [Clostridia bacterium]|nr:hypothetical protein [Clostridia bacterium]